MKRLFILSLPKAGTYFLAEIAKNLGVPFSGLHISGHDYMDQREASPEELARDPDRFLVPSDLEASLALVRPGEFAVGHLPYAHAPLLKGWDTVFLVRPMRDVVVSSVKYYSKIAAPRHESPEAFRFKTLPMGEEKILLWLSLWGEEFAKLAASMEGWASGPTVTYDQLRSPEVVGKIFGQNATAAVTKALAADTITRSESASDHRAWWTDAVEHAFRSCGLDVSYVDKPLCRWTVGPVHPTGLEILTHSVRRFRKCFGDLFDLVVCYNQISPTRLAHLGVKLYDQSVASDVVGSDSAGFAWKLRPPRLRMHRHELILDNDLIVEDGGVVREFLLGNRPYATEGTRRLFGRFGGMVPAGVRVNSGFIGLPPGFDFGRALAEKKGPEPLRDWGDEQGLVAATLCSVPHKLIPLSRIYVCDSDYRKTPDGTHFVRANSGRREHWQAYKKSRTL